MDVEEDIEELKELVRENIAATKETSRLVRKMRRTALWSWVFQIVWWLIIAGITGAAYYYYVQPYVAKIEQLYGISQEQSQSWDEQITNFLKFFNQQQAARQTTPPPAPSTSTTTP